ncbi:hypothetical protein ACFQJC_06670 [Haloferax namakaokahaiae]|uniref:Uncharacterized protein n=1 Tax=Haloferax namakaokahaiae TaxID=1748331 RepID=A0ABD5ZD87_9EURY
MTEQPEPKSVEAGDEYFHVEYADPDEFDSIRTPDWAAHASDSVSQGSEIRMGHHSDSDEWEIQSVLIKKSVGEDKAREQANKIVEKLSS